MAVGHDGWAAFTAVPVAAALLDGDLVVVEVTDAYCAATSRGRAQLRGRHLFDVFPDVAATGEDEDSRYEPVLREVLRTGRPSPARVIEYPIPTGADPARFEERWWNFAAHPVTDAEGAVTAVLSVLVDVTAAVRTGRAAATRDQLSTELRQRTEALQADLSAREEEAAAAVVAERVSARRLAGLAGVALALVGAETVAELTEVVIGRGLSVLGCDGGAVATLAPDDPGVLELTTTAGFAHRTGGGDGRLPLHGPLPASVAAATRRRVLLADREASVRFTPHLEQAMADTGSQAFASAPLVVGERVLGSLTVGWRAPQTFTAGDVAMLDAFAAQCAQALDRILVRDAERASATSARRMSEVLQRSLLTAPPQPDHLEIAVRYLPAVDDAQVGGDWYDAFTTRTGSTSIVIGDVAGHDRDAAAAMGQVRNLLRGIGYAIGEPPAMVLSELDRALRDLAVPALATCVLAQVKQDDAGRRAGQRALVWSSAGHLPPLLLHPDGRPELLRTEPDMLLGLAPETARADHELLVDTGSTLLLYTDGLVERRHVALDEGLAWLAGAASRLAALPLEELCDAVLAQLPDGVDDDVALIAVRLHPQDRPGPPAAGPPAGPVALGGDADPDLA